MRNYIQNNRWALTLAAIFMLVVSPIYVPYCMVKDTWPEIKGFYVELYYAITVGPKFYK